MVSGIQCNEEVYSVYKLLKNDRSIKAMIMKINEKPEVIVEHQWKTAGFDHDEFINKLPSDDGRFAIMDFEYETQDGRKDFKIVFILWCPINCKPQKKMKYSTSVGGIANALGAIAINIQADSISDITYDSLKGKLLDKFK